MDPTSPIAAATAVLTAFILASLASKFIKVPETSGRFAPIDGLRGYLSFLVFLHHSCIWYFYLHEGKWRPPSSNLYTHFGGSSVALFFMITGFLFFSKVTQQDKKVDWIQIYVSRILRLAPLYMATVGLIFVTVAVLSAGKLNEPLIMLLKNSLRWLLFTIPGTPDLNGVERTRYIVAGVTWSLAYEWFFYISLPAFALLARARAPFNHLGLLFVFCYLLILGEYFYLSFFGGVAASLLMGSQNFTKFAKSRIASVIISACLILTVFLFSTPFSIMPLVLLSITFILIAGGNSLFGIFTNKASHVLGDMAYSIYLLHGLLLFVCFKFIVGFESAATMTPFQHWAVILCATPALIVICFLSSTYIEKPPMRAAMGVSNWISSKFLTAAKVLRFRP